MTLPARSGSLEELFCDGCDTYWVTTPGLSRNDARAEVAGIEGCRYIETSARRVIGRIELVTEGQWFSVDPDGDVEAWQVTVAS